MDTTEFDYVPGGPNPGGKCKCGCGRQTNPAPANKKEKGLLKGQAQEYLRNHAAHQLIRDRNTWGEHRWTVEDRGYETPCWIWLGAKKETGYGKAVWPISNKHVAAHRRSWIEAGNEDVPEGYELDHLCKVRSCVNPDHLRVVTHVENMLTATSTKMTAEKVREIRARYADGETQTALAAEFGIRQTNVSMIVNQQTWKDV